MKFGYYNIVLINVSLKSPYSDGSRAFRRLMIFLLLRAIAQDESIELAQWWTQFQESSEAEQLAMMQALKLRNAPNPGVNVVKKRLQMIECYLGLGANQQDPVRVLHMAKNKLHTLPNTHIGKYAPIIQTPPFGVLGQPIFYNQVIQIWTSLSPENIADRNSKIEKTLGRIRNLVWGPRKVDIDILI